MSMMDIGHVPVFVLGLGMRVFVGVSHVSDIMHVKLVVAMPVLMDNGHVDMKMGVLLICQ